MNLSEVYQALGQQRFNELIGGVSMGSLRTYRVYDSFKVHTHLHKLNRERLRKAIPHLWARLEQGDETLAREISQGVLVSNLSFVVEVLDFLGVEHDGSGFFQKGEAAKERLTEGWQQRVFDHFREKYPEPIILLYINHLDWELGEPGGAFVPA